MYYEMLAKELVSIRGKFHRVPAHQKISKMMRGELFVLYYLDEHGGTAHPKNLSENLAVSTARIASLLNHMEEKGLVIRLDDPEDNRQVIVRLTQKGAEEIARAKTDVLRCVSEVLEYLGPEDAQAYVRIQRKICQGLSCPSPAPANSEKAVQS